jgi:hypothetical protein
MSIEISVGSGQIIVSGVGRGKKEGVGIYNKPDHGMPIDSPVAADILKDVVPDVIIWFENMGGVRLFQDQVNSAALRMNGYDVKNQEEN